MKHFYLFFSILSLSSILSFGQSVTEIKQSRNYLWGEGNGITLNEADKNALSMLINQISVSVESQFEMQKTENEDGEVSEQVKSIINTYSSASLQNTERIVISQEPDAKVLRYIRRSDVNKIFSMRETKIKEFCNYAQTALDDLRVSDGIKYYYWAYTLLRSHPDQNEITYMDELGQTHLLSIWLPERINQVIAGIDIKIKDREISENHSMYKLDISYNNQPVEKLVYQYWIGQDYTNHIEAGNGLGIAEFFDEDSNDREKIQFKLEYMFRNESLYDKELNTVMERLPGIPFKSAYINVRLDESTEASSITQVMTQDENNSLEILEEETSETENSSESISILEDISTYETLLTPIISGIESKDYENIKPLFTEKGYEIFTKLISYGNARIIDQPDFKGMKKGDITIIRSVPMLFSFATNNRQFVENVVFYFDSDMKVCDLSFSLSNTALSDIWSKNQWKEEDRLVIVDFLEHYKTAYALERLDYIESIFSDDALIITGSYTTNPYPESPYKNNRIVRYNQYTKKEYIDRLRHLFQSKEYINLQFEKSDIRAGKKEHVYGIQIKQNYYSSNYGDEGYLFLLVDLQDTSKPSIHVRTWQPEPDAESGIYGLEDF